MNTTEIKVKNIIRSFDDLYKYAKKQFLEYEKIEGINDWKEYSFSIDCSQDQMKFKDMLQIRCIEELTEATHTLDNEEHFYEEVTDSLNFFLSSYIMLDVNFNDFEDPSTLLSGDKTIFTEDEIKLSFYNIVDDIGDLCNLLKNRPWSQSNYLVSMYDFNIRLKKLWDTYWKVISDLGLRPNDIFTMFEKKYEVNKWRIKTGYQ